VSQPHQFRTSKPPETATAPAARRTSDGRSLLQIFAAVVGATFLLVGILGFIPGVTQNYDELAFAGTDSSAELLGLFRVSILHNIVHMLFGVGLVAAARPSWSATFLIGGGVLYVGVVLYGVLIDETSDANFLPINDADNVLHLVLAIGMIALGLIGLAADRRRGATAGYAR
jgi:hypothetical protein